MMEREELERRYRIAQLHAATQAGQQADNEQEPQESEPESPTLAQIMGVNVKPDLGMTREEHLRRIARGY